MTTVCVLQHIVVWSVIDTKKKKEKEMKNKKKNVDLSLDLGIVTSKENGDVLGSFPLQLRIVHRSAVSDFGQM